MPPSELLRYNTADSLRHDFDSFSIVNFFGCIDFI